MGNFLSIIIAAALVNNVVLVQFIGVSSVFSFSNRLQNAIELALFSFLVMFVSSSINLLLFRFLLEPLGLEFLKLICFVSTSAVFTCWLSLTAQHRFPLSSRQHKLAFYLIGTNSAVIGVSLMSSVRIASLGESLAYGFGAAMGFSLILIAFAAMKLRLDTADVPMPFRGAPIQLISAGIVALCLLGFAGMV